MKKITINLAQNSYDINIGKDILKDAKQYLKLDRKVFILTDAGVPIEYSKTISQNSKDAIIFIAKQGERSKSIFTFTKVLKQMLAFGMTRADVLVAVGGGVAGDLGGFVASSYMRGIDYYQIPTTMLSQIDSSIGGKCAINFENTKNIVGSFYQPKGVLIDINTLKTLDSRHISSGLAESIKMSMIADENLFNKFETEAITIDNIEEIIYSSLLIKKNIVEQDEKETNLRKTLNFGHTLGHGIESDVGLNALTHGECVALGMLPMCSDDVRERLINLLKKFHLPTNYPYDLNKVLDFVMHDKKRQGDFIDTVFVGKIGSCEIKRYTLDEYKAMIKERLNLE